MDDPTVRAALLQHIVGGWSGWKTVEGTEVAFSPENLRRIAQHDALFAVIVAKSQSLSVEYRSAVEENLAPGPPTSPAAEETSQE